MLERMKKEDISVFVTANQTYTAALRESPLSADELRLYKMHAALHSVNGGELFSVELENE